MGQATRASHATLDDGTVNFSRRLTRLEMQIRAEIEHLKSAGGEGAGNVNRGHALFMLDRIEQARKGLS